MKFYLYRVKLDHQGYTSWGRYFGVGAPLYYYEPVKGSTCHGDHGYLRAHSREEAKNMVATAIPDATFYK
jgi:hypothetical protein